MDNTTLLLIVITNFLLVIIMGVLAMLVYRLIKNQKTTGDVFAQNEKYHPEIIDRMKDLHYASSKKSELFCPNHTEEPGEASCAICDKLFCKTCIKPFKSMHFCREHLTLIMQHDWEEVLTLKTSTHHPEDGVKLFDIKKQLLQELNLPTYIETHYKINVDQDYIETYLVLFSIKENVGLIKKNLSDFTLVQ